MGISLGPFILELKNTSFVKHLNLWTKAIYGIWGFWTAAFACFPISFGASVCVNWLLVQLWVMKDYEVEDSWTKLTFDLPVMNYIKPQFVTPIGW